MVGTSAEIATLPTHMMAVTAPMAAKVLGVSDARVRQMVADDTLRPCTMLGNKYLFRRTDVEALVSSRKVSL